MLVSELEFGLSRFAKTITDDNPGIDQPLANTRDRYR